MANQNPPKKNQTFILGITLQDAADNVSFKSSATIASGDFKISKDGGAFANLTNLPAVTPASSVGVELSLTATEMNADRVLIVGIDQTSPKEWSDFSISISTTA